MTKLRLLDLYGCAGGAARGYQKAGWYVVSVDIKPQPRNCADEFIQADAFSLTMDFIRSFDAAHASPICQGHTLLRHAPGTKEHPELIEPTRRLLEASGLPWVMENVEGARSYMRDPITLCGSMFGLGVECGPEGERTFYQLRRHRLFESNIAISAPCGCAHTDPVIGIYGGHVRCRSSRHGGRLTRDFVGEDKPALARAAMGMDWATMHQMSEAIPPAYTHHLGLQLMAEVQRRRAA